jgi:hypothetical protein
MTTWDTFKVELESAIKKQEGHYLGYTIDKRMSQLNNPDGSHSKHSIASKWLEKFYSPLSKMLHEEKIYGLEISDDGYEFIDRETGKRIRIKFTEK